MPEHFSFLFQYLKKQGIIVDQDEFVFQIQSHPNYPSLLSISDTLTFLKVNNTATSVNTIADIPDNCIALLNDTTSGNYLTFAERTNKGFKYLKNGKYIQVTEDEFKTIFSNIILIAEKSENEETKRSNKTAFYATLLITGLIYLAVVFANGFYVPTFLFLLLAVSGVYLSVQAISGELGITTKFSEAVCGGVATNSSCNEVFKSTTTKLTEIISFSDISITFYVAQLLSILLFSIANQLNDFFVLTLISLVFAFPVTIYSFYLQKFVAKKWCPICLSIIGVLYAELIWLLFISDIGISIQLKSVLYYSFTLIASYTLAVSIKKMLQTNVELKSKILETTRFKRNYSIFKMALTANGKISHTEAITSGNIILGNPNAKLKIVMITSPYCGYCGGAHKIIEQILELYSDKVAVHIRFNVNPIYAEEKGLTIFYKLITIYFNQGQDAFLKAMHTWFLNKDETKLSEYDTQVNPKINNFQLLLDQYVWNQKNNTPYTPAFIINDYIYPTQYSRDELIHFINELEDDESFAA